MMTTTETIETDNKQASLLTVPLFRECEVLWDHRQALGHGTFCSVWPLRRIALRKWQATAAAEDDGSRSPQAHPSMCNTTRRVLAEQVNQATDHTRPRNATNDNKGGNNEDSSLSWAVKHIRLDLEEQQEAFVRQDLQTELKILQALPSHPYIISLYGVGIANYDDDNDKVADDDDSLNANANAATSAPRIQPTFLILEQLPTTLAAQLENWQQQHQQQEGSSWMTLFSSSYSNPLVQAKQAWRTRVNVLYQLADALSAVHQHGFIYRDVKASNVGLKNHCKQVKLFDFGLAKQLPRRRDDDDNNDHTARFSLTAQTGTLLYMAPEVMRGEPYGVTADVYSMAILMHQVLSLEQCVWDEADEERLAQAVLRHQYRPSVTKHRGHGEWPAVLCDTLVQMWTEDPTQRPRMSAVVEMLQQVLNDDDDDPPVVDGNKLYQGAMPDVSSPSSFPWSTYWQGKQSNGENELFWQ